MTFRDAGRGGRGPTSRKIGRDTFVENLWRAFIRKPISSAISRKPTRSRRWLADIKEPRGRSAGRIRRQSGCWPIARSAPASLPIDNRGQAPALELHRVYVYPGAPRGVGVGPHPVDLGRSSGARPAWGGGSLSRRLARERGGPIAVYRSRGFETVGAYKFRVGDTLDDEDIMRLKLI